MINYINKLKTRLAEGKVVPVVGAGVSFACAGLPNWSGLISSGLDYAESIALEKSSIQLGRELLKDWKLTEAAGIVKALLNAPNRPYINWLENTLGRPSVKSEALIESIQNLCQPIIATTNYDDLLRNVGTIETNLALDWQQHEEVQRCIAASKSFIFHLHGIYSRPDTAVFSTEDYERLKSALGYKHILQDLWMNRTFLFIGCSRDGVMDEDFSTLLKIMRDWFPNVSGEHYLLVRDDEIGSAAHQELMKECNVHMVPYGMDHESLPHFINGINPNAEVIIKRFEKRKAKVFEGLSRILVAQSGEERQSNVETFVKENLGSPHYWLDNDQLSVFDAAVENYNKLINDKQQRFRNKQLVARAIVNVVQLEKNIDLWNQSWRESTKVNNAQFINMGIFAYQALEKFSKDILRDIQLRHPNLIHPAFFEGRLKEFYLEALDWKERSGGLEEFEGDDYFFENLKRIMDSLKSVLSLSPSDLYEEKKPAKTVSQLPAKILLTLEEACVRLNEVSAPHNTLAELPWQDRLDFEDAKLIKHKDEKVVVACNALHCLRWNPCTDLEPVNFYVAKQDEKIWEIVVVEEGNDVILNVFTSRHCITIINFSETIETKLASGYGEYTRLKKSGRVFCSVAFSAGLKDNSVFEFISGAYVPVVSREQIRHFWSELIVHFPEMENQDGASEVEFKMNFQDVTLSAVEWKQEERLVLRCRIGHDIGPPSTVLFFFDPQIGFDLPLLKVLFAHKNCFTFDSGNDGDSVNLIAGFLDYNEVGNLIQFFKAIDKSELIVADNQPGVVPQDLIRTTTHDMFNAIYIGQHALMLEEGRKIHEISLPGLSVKETSLSKRIKRMSVN
ncbi:SIR2 family protein [Pedobacter fastidiosus]|uniref:SIR2 family protein n=1 Tax=Pedobacter fastidiosus TaxID=2765361 RepID=A0ABR7KXC8_9SPHI|nr:SIR2 family protein [Pedobacter fastidiosus]MBC6112773.1 SIR2 family protein [Pedobacter fastidiosus]